jgi:hypothetical protein
LAYGNVLVSGDARIRGYAQVSEEAQIYGGAQIYGYSQICGNTHVHSDMTVRDGVVSETSIDEPTDNTEELEAAILKASNALKQGLEVIDTLMPGVRHLALQDYQSLNETPARMREALESLEKLL